MDGVMHPSVEQAIGRDRIRKAFKRYENNPADEHDRGIVRAVNSDGSYEVLLDGDVQTARCAPYAKAVVGDRVIVVTTKDGENVLLGRLGGEIGGGGEVVTTVNDASNYVAGKVFAHAGTNDPVGALLCDGRAVSRTTYWELFDAIGTTYGAGDGSSTFNLPNIESRTIIGEGTGESGTEYALGATGGEEKHAQTVEELATHTHSSSTYAYRSGSQYGWLSTPSGNTTAYGAIDVNYAGGGQPFNVMQPYIVMRYFITTGKGDPASGINPADYVVEWGETDGWYWEKWASGKAECWRYLLYENIEISNYYESLRYYQAGAVAFPFTFEENPQITATANTGNGLVGVTVYTLSPSSFALWLTNPLALTTTVNVMVHVKGKWKDSPASGGTETIAPTIAERFEKLEGEAPIASGTSGDWEWIKFASGLAFLFLHVQPPNANGHVAQGVYSYPFTLTSVFGQVATINDNGDNAYGALTATVKAINATDALLLSLHSVDAYFNSWLPPVTAVVVGRWK